MKKGLKSYDKKRNNVLEHYNFGVSRMSCYLNLGIVSPFKMMKTIFNENVFSLESKQLLKLFSDCQLFIVNYNV